MIALDDLQGALWRDDRQTAEERAAVFMDPWWQTVPREYRLAWHMRHWRLENAHTAGYATVEEHQAAVEEEIRARAAGEVTYERPPAEVTTRDPRPADAPADPPALVKLAASADPGWEVRLGYSRAWKKLGRGNVGTSADARWALHHFVSLQARPAGTPVRACLWVIYAAEAVEGKLAWKHDMSMVPDDFDANVTKAKAALMAPPSEVLMARITDLVSRTRQPVTSTTDIFGTC